MRATGLGAGAGGAFAAEGLHPTTATDHVAVDMAVADPKPREDVAHALVDAAVDAERQATADRGDLVDDLFEPVGRPAPDSRIVAKHLAFEARRTVDLKGVRRKKAPC
jgi:hypothetical protein